MEQESRQIPQKEIQGMGEVNQGIRQEGS